jgi:hypothetical protein
MPISNGFDTTQVMAKLFGRIKWRSLNPAGSVYPLAYSITGTRADLFLTAGVSAGLVAGGTSYTNSSLIGWTYDVERRGFGTMEQGVDYEQDPVNGGFSLLVPGDKWTGNEKLIIHFQPRTTVAPPVATARWFEEFHPMVTLNNLKDVVEEEHVATDDTWYNKLVDIEQGVIMTLLNGVFNEPQLIESTLIWDRQLRNDLPYTNMGKFVGYRLFVAPGEFALQISRISFMFNGDANFNLYLFQDMKKAPLYSIPVSVTGHDETYVDLPNWILNYTSPMAQGGTFYLGYFQNDLGSVQALEQFVTRWNRSLAFGYTAFEAVQVTGQYDFNRIQVPYTYRTYGMNLEVQTYKDFTNRVIKNASLFDEAIGLAMAIVVLGYEAYSARSNGTERITKEMATLIYGELNNSGEAKEINPYIAGLKLQLRRELSRINRNFFSCDEIVTTRPYEGNGNSLQGVFP